MTRAHSLVPLLASVLASACALPMEEPVGRSEGAITSGLGVPIADFNGDGLADLAVGVPNDDVSTPKGLIGDAGSVHVFYGNGAGLSTDNDEVWTQQTAGVPGDPGVGDHFGKAIVAADFDGDHVTDLAIGTPDEANLAGAGAALEAGTVTILYGKKGVGLTSTSAVSFDVGVATSVRSQDHFGSVLSAGDIDGDGRDDLAVGVPDYDVFGVDGTLQDGAGMVLIAAGNRGANGFSNFRVLDARLTAQDYPLPQPPEKGARFGAAVVVADFDASGTADVVVGVPLADYHPDNAAQNETDSGHIALFERDGGFALTFLDAQVLQQDGAWDGLPGSSEDGDRLGAALTAGDFNGDGYQDVAVGIPGEDWGGDGAGAITILLGEDFGLSSLDDEFFSQAATLVEGAAESGDHFGAALVAADFNGDGYDDLAVGVPDEKESGIPGAGAVNVLYGKNNGLSASGDQFFAQDYNGLLGKPQAQEGFGSALARGDFNSDGYADLVVGIPKDIVSALAVPSGSVDVAAGEIEIILGSSANGLVTTGEVELNRESSGVADTCTAGDAFGISLAGG